MAADAPPLSAETLAELKRSHAEATQPPWCWSFVGEKSNGYVIGTGCDETGQPVSGLVGGDDVVDTVLRNPCVIGEHEAEPCDYDDPRLIVDVRNRLGALLALAERALAQPRKPASDEEIENAVAEALGEEPWRDEVLPVWRACERFHGIAAPAARAGEQEDK